MTTVLREAGMDDADVVLKWRNDPLTRNSSFSKNLIDSETHIQWFNKKLSDENCFMFILWDRGERVGQLRIDRVKNVGEISYMIAPDKRNMGYGKKIIELSESVVPVDIKVLTGLVENSNEPSKKCFKGNNYAEITGGNVTCYIKVL